MGCRFPGACDPGRLWRLLLDGKDMVSPAPPPGRLPGSGQLLDRRPRTPGKLISIAGGFLGTLEEPTTEALLTDRESAVIDPQHRILLAVTAEALADAGLTVQAVEGREFGVFMGQSTAEHWD